MRLLEIFPNKIVNRNAAKLKVPWVISFWYLLFYSFQFIVSFSCYVKFLNRRLYLLPFPLEACLDPEHNTTVSVVCGLPSQTITDRHDHHFSSKRTMEGLGRTNLGLLIQTQQTHCSKEGEGWGWNAHVLVLEISFLPSFFIQRLFYDLLLKLFFYKDATKIPHWPHVWCFCRRNYELDGTFRWGSSKPSCLVLWLHPCCVIFLWHWLCASYIMD